MNLAERLDMSDRLLDVIDTMESVAKQLHRANTIARLAGYSDLFLNERIRDVETDVKRLRELHERVARGEA